MLVQQLFMHVCTCVYVYVVHIIVVTFFLQMCIAFHVSCGGHVCVLLVS